MSKSERPKNRKIKIVGGGTRWSRDVNPRSTSGSMKAARRAKRKQAKASKKRGR